MRISSLALLTKKRNKSKKKNFLAQIIPKKRIIMGGIHYFCEQNEMKKLISSLRLALSSCYKGDELQTVIKALCCELLGIDEYTFYLKDDVILTPAQCDALNLAMHRLQRGEPLQYVLGSAPFDGLTLKVDESVLIPRPETSQLARLALEYAPGKSFLDVGTGSGCIAIALAKDCKEGTVAACDISDKALATARHNARANHADVNFLNADLLSVLSGVPLPEELQGMEVDCIVSNPPYIRRSERIFMERRVLDYEPALALFVPDDDPLLFYRALALWGQTHLLRPNGAICVEINRDFGFETAVLFEHYGYNHIQVHPDLFGNERFVTCQKKA